MKTVMKLYIPLIALGSYFLIGCSGDDLSFGQSATTTVLNSGVVSQNNIAILAADSQPKVHDNATGVSTFTEVDMTVYIGDRNNQVLTDAHTIRFRAEWGLIEPSCVTVDGSCTVKWRTSEFNTMPFSSVTGHSVRIVAYTEGEEEFNDVNDNGMFDDLETHVDIGEPFLDGINMVANPNDIRDGMYFLGGTSNDQIIDVLNANNPVLPLNGINDMGDGLFNGPGCTHSSMCSPSTSTVVWDAITLDLDGGDGPP